jgi:hypothetical protein
MLFFSIYILHTFFTTTSMMLLSHYVLKLYDKLHQIEDDKNKKYYETYYKIAQLEEGLYEKLNA